jgi:hypothetical protein
MPHPYPQENINVMFEAIMLLNDPLGIVISLLVHGKTKSEKKIHRE